MKVLRVLNFARVEVSPRSAMASLLRRISGKAVIFEQRELDAQSVGGLYGWSGNTQRLPSLGADGLLACCSPQFCDSQLRSQNPAVPAISC